MHRAPTVNVQHHFPVRRLNTLMKPEPHLTPSAQGMFAALGRCEKWLSDWLKPWNKVKEMSLKGIDWTKNQTSMTQQKSVSNIVAVLFQDYKQLLTSVKSGVGWRMNAPQPCTCNKKNYMACYSLLLYDKFPKITVHETAMHSVMSLKKNDELIKQDIVARQNKIDYTQIFIFGHKQIHNK